MFSAPKSDYLVPFDGSFRVSKAPTDAPKDAPKKRECRELLAEKIAELQQLQDVLYASDNHAILLIFQAMDAAGKDGTIKAVMSGVNPAGCQVYSFKQPSAEEIDHDFLWRTSKCLPERGRIGIFNRSYYEEVLVVRVHPQILENQRLPDLHEQREKIFEQRLESLADHEKHLARNGTIVLKFWLNVSRDEQRQRFLKRIDDPERNWKFSMSDVRERGHWDDYMHAYQEALNATSRDYAPWYAIPADNKAYMRLQVASILVETLRSLKLQYPTLDKAAIERLKDARATLLKEG
jgi:PPK2 family polyphosphate:nucleotide phosphotransferase